MDRGFIFIKMTLKWLYLYLYYQWSCCNVMFSVASVCQSVILSTRVHIWPLPMMHWSSLHSDPSPAPALATRTWDLTVEGHPYHTPPGMEISLHRDALHMRLHCTRTPWPPGHGTSVVRDPTRSSPAPLPPPPGGWHLVDIEACMG